MSDARNSGPVAIVTGAASGIGLAVATALCRQGRAVALCDRDAQALERATKSLRGEGGQVRAQAFDVRDVLAVERAVSSVEAELGPIDAAVLAAGVLHVGRATEVTDEHWVASLDVNASGVFHVARAATRRMAERGRGALVTVASNAGSTPRVDMAAYCAAKAAAIMFTKCLGLELAPRGVRCNVVSPGSTDTPMLRTFVGFEAGAFDSAIAGDATRYRLGIPLGRIASPEDVASAVLFLLSQESRHITMQELRVDGGATL